MCPRAAVQGGAGGGGYINDLHAIKHDPDGGHTLVAGAGSHEGGGGGGALGVVRAPLALTPATMR